MGKSEEQAHARRLLASHPSSIRVTEWAHKRLMQMMESLQVEIQLHPENFPGYAGRRITLSDTIVLMCERFIS